MIDDLVFQLRTDPLIATSYIQSIMIWYKLVCRYYRAPELIFGSTEYTTAIDVWSGGCVLAELLLGTPLFPGSSGVDQLVEIIKILGTPTKEELHEMNPNYQEFKFPQIRASPWASVFKPNTPPQALDLASKYLEYKPKHRLLAIESCSHPFFDELRNPATTLLLNPSGGAGASIPTPLPAEMFQWTQEEMALMPEMEGVLTPAHLKEGGGDVTAAASGGGDVTAKTT